ncbi:hypothetical protein RN001_012049 [Aquatica leii]|uniref:BTB domain-containing protein n=1 Tax=Aquatica leii TaxID=1421715 RepID=A0AAN7SD43_9COLE|nr:hypothetical protein RN001_012049 [Aquatica leii]
MRRAFTTNEDGTVKDSTDSDGYCLDNLDLLNLRVSFSSDGTIKSHNKSSKKKFQNKNEIYCAGDSHQQSHQPKRCQVRKIIKSKNQFQNEPDYNNLLLLYSNQKSFTDQQQRKPKLKRTVKNNQQPTEVCTVDIHTVTPEMTHRRKLPVKKPEIKKSGTFPFQVTPSGNLKVNSQQVVFESQKLSVLVADPKNTKVNFNSELEKIVSENMATADKEFPRQSVMESIMGPGCFGGSLGSLIASTAPAHKDKESSEYEGKVTDQILDPELTLSRLGYTASEPIDWHLVKLPEKSNLYLELYQRITNYTNADCKVYIDNEQFNCHLIVLQCYSEVFDEYVAVKKVELPSDKVSTGAFAFIYEWMITGEPAYTELSRETVLDIFNAAKYLKIKDLTEQCWAFIDNTEVFSEDTAFMLYMDAKHKDLEDVRELMLPRIQVFFLMLVSSQDWLELEKADVMNFLSSNYICVNCEMEIYMSAIRWLKHKWQERQDDVLDIMTCVRFGNIAPWQLVDIKRNPENPDFLRLASIPEICKMIDDGLAFVIIKYWYGQENDDFQHWNNILGLQEPPARNWSGMDKTYFTYREFLIYLDQYRRNQIMEKSKPRDKKHSMSVERKATVKPEGDKWAPRIPTMDEFLSTRKSRGAFTTSTPTKENSKIVAAVTIQSAFRGYLVRQMLKQYVPKMKVKSPRNKLVLPLQNRNQEETQNLPNQAQLPWSLGKNYKVLSMFTQRKVEHTSNSIMTPASNDYLTESSLFSSDRESVLVFGGIDPHNSYGVARNTGKDILKYLPDNNVWEYVGDLPAPRHHHSVTFLKGRVYLCGGADPRDDDFKGKSVVVDTVWSFDPVKRVWFNEGNLNTARKNFGLVASNYTVYAIGGQDRQGRTLASVEKFVPEVGTWEFVAPLQTPRMGIACTKYRNYIWVAGGMSGSRHNPLSDTVECYDTKKNQWTEITGLKFPRCFSRMFSMSDKLYLLGGAGKIQDQDKTTSSVPDIDIWDTENLKWKHHTDMAIPRHGHAIAYLGTQILIIGGVTTVYMRALSNTECYCTERGTWVRGIACLPTTLSGHAAVTLPPASLL